MPPSIQTAAKEATETDPAQELAGLNALLAKYKEPSIAKSAWQLGDSAIPYFILWTLMAMTVQRHYGLTLLLAIPAAGFLVRLFIIQHDCGHGSFFRRPVVNDVVGSIIGIVTAVPYHYWRKTHAIHHATTGNLDRRGFGDVDTLTVREYLALPTWKRLRYRLYRSPLVLISFGGLYQFVIYHRFSSIAPKPWKAERLSILLTDLAWVLLLVAAHYTIGIGNLFLLQLPLHLITAAIGVWLFYVQHQFEETYWNKEADWDFALAAMRGSSYYKMPRVLQWFTGNIGFHHIHHLNSRVPNYNLERCMKENAEFQRVTELTLWNSLRCASLALWDEERGKLIAFRELAA